MADFMDLHRVDVATPLGIVHLVGFAMDGPHRPVIFRILSEVSGLDLSAADLVQDDDHPRPRFPRLDFDVNWTHSAGVCVVAYGEPGILVGVDLEKHSPRHLRLAERFYHAEEVDFLRNLESDLGSAESTAEKSSVQVEFYRLWSRKEALYKCVGGSFFEGAISRSVLNSPLMAGPVDCLREVHFVDLDGSIFTNKKAAGIPAALCVAVSSSR